MGFNVTNVDPTYKGRSTTLVPHGTYRLEIVSAEERVSKASGDSKYVEFGISILEPSEFAGQFFYQKTTTVNSNPVAKQIGDNQIAAIGNAVGLLAGEYEDLCHKSFVAMVEIEKGTNGYSDKNKLGRVYWEEGSAPKGLGPMSAPPSVAPEPVRQAPAARPAAAAATGARPWAKRA
jgi:hypothetical protein